jgi:putative ABC transport system substrate-binding protein
MIRRRDFITLLGGAAATWPLAAWAQERMTLVGLLAPAATPNVAALLDGLKEAGYIEGRNLAMEYRFADGRIDQLPALACRRGDRMRRRKFITLLGGAAAAWPLTAQAQRAVTPVIGFLARGPNGPKRWGPPFYQGLKDAGYVEGQNVAIEYRGWEPRIESGGRSLAQLTEIATEFVRRQVTVILTSNDAPALAAKRATSTIPIVFFNIGSDPVTLGLAASLNRPGGNVTGAGFDNPQLGTKRLDLLCQLVPTAATVAHLVRRRNLLSFEEQQHSLAATAGALGRQLIVVECPGDDELGHAFATLVERGAGAVIVGPLFNFTVVPFAAQYMIPAMYGGGDFVLRGGLMSYTLDPADEIRLATGLVGKILDGAIPTNLPIRNSTKTNFIINLKTAKALGLDVPPTLLTLADEVIE